MESKILPKISWRLHPVTPHAIVKQLSILLPSPRGRTKHFVDEDIETCLVIMLSQYQTLRDTPSTLAFGAVVAAFTYANLSVGPIWKLIEELGNLLEPSKIVSYSTDMLGLLTMYTPPVLLPSLSWASSLHFL